MTVIDTMNQDVNFLKAEHVSLVNNQYSLSEQLNQLQERVLSMEDQEAVDGFYIDGNYEAITDLQLRVGDLEDASRPTSTPAPAPASKFEVEYFSDGFKLSGTGSRDDLEDTVLRMNQACQQASLYNQHLTDDEMSITVINADDSCWAQLGAEIGENTEYAQWCVSDETQWLPENGIPVSLSDVVTEGDNILIGVTGPEVAFEVTVPYDQDLRVWLGDHQYLPSRIQFLVTCDSPNEIRPYHLHAIRKDGKVIWPMSATPTATPTAPISSSTSYTDTIVASEWKLSWNNGDAKITNGDRYMMIAVCGRPSYESFENAFKGFQTNGWPVVIRRAYNGWDHIIGIETETGEKVWVTCPEHPAVAK